MIGGTQRRLRRIPVKYSHNNATTTLNTNECKVASPDTLLDIDHPKNA